MKLRRGEIIAAASGLLLLVFMFALTWYAVSGALRQTLAINLHSTTSYNGWHGLTHIRWLLLVTALAALALAYFQVTARGPAIPVTLAVIVTVLGGLTTLVLIYRVILNTPGNHLDQRAGAYLGLLATVGIAYGGFRSMREESGTDPAALDIETVSLRGQT